MLLNSSNLSNAEYNEATATLTITFTGGGEYEYHGVPKSVFDNLQSASSPGSFFAQAIRGRYQTIKL